MLGFRPLKSLAPLKIERQGAARAGSGMGGREAQPRTPCDRSVAPRRRGTRASLLLWACALLVAPLPLARADAADEPRGDEDPYVVLIQDSNGFPGAEQSSELARQQVAIQGDRLRMLDPAHQWALFVDLAERVVREANVGAQQYVERPFQTYKKYKLQREKNLAAQKEEFLRTKQRLEDDKKALRQWIDTYRRAGGDPEQPGRIVARLQHYPQDEKVVALWVDGEERQVKLEHYVIRENHADVPVFDLWITRDVTIPVDLLRFYRELGTFSAPVSERLQQVPGTIVACTAVVDTGSLKKTFRNRVIEIRTQDTPQPLGVPDPWERVEEKPEASASAEAAAVSCAVCDKKVPVDKAITFREPWGPRRTHALCSTEHRRELVRRLAAERKKSSADKSASGKK